MLPALTAAASAHAPAAPRRLSYSRNAVRPPWARQSAASRSASLASSPSCSRAAAGSVSASPHNVRRPGRSAGTAASAAALASSQWFRRRLTAVRLPLRRSAPASALQPSQPMAFAARPRRRSERWASMAAATASAPGSPSRLRDRSSAVSDVVLPIRAASAGSEAVL